MRILGIDPGRERNGCGKARLASSAGEYDPNALKRLLYRALLVLGIGLVASAVSLVHHAPSVCTSSERGWPLGIIVYPCLCYGMRGVEWFVDPFGFVVNAILFAGVAGTLWLLVLLM